MTRAVVLRLEGPMQSWGGPVAGDDRPTLDAPTKSGVFGLVSGALGIDRADVQAIRALHDGLGFVVRVDRPGVAAVDFQTIEQVPTINGRLRGDYSKRDGKPEHNPIVSRRGYLYDGAFTALLVERAGLATPLERIAEALRFPRYLPFLGRRACPPSERVLIAPDVHEGPSWRSILAAVPVAEPGEHQPGGGEILADADLILPGRGVVERRVRDVTAGTAPRFFDERRVHRAGRDTTEGWGA